MGKYVHVSFDVVDQFEPRLPETFAPTEDRTIKRICVTDRILLGLNAIAGGGWTLEVMRKLGLPRIIHVYYMESDDVMGPDEVQQYVPDAKNNHESWILRTPDCVRRVDYEVIDPVLHQFQDNPDPTHMIVASAPLRRIPFADNVTNLINRFHVTDPEQLDAFIRTHGFSKTVCNMEPYLLMFAEKEETLRKERAL